MPIGSTNVYNPGDLILSTVSGSGTSFIETKIIAATSSFILFNSSGTLTSASLNSIVATTSSYVSGSTSIITNLTASNISASGTSSFGYVGIGTTNPTARLHVSGSTGGVFEVDTAGGTTTLYVSASGNVGIGTSIPGSLLQVGGSGATSTATPTAIQMDNSFRNAVGGNTSLKFYLYKNNTETYGFGLNTSAGIEYHAGISGGGIANHAFYTDTTERLRIQSDGNVGIGTSSPNAKLDVNGNIIVTGSLTVTSTIVARNYIMATDTLYIQKGVGGYQSYITAEQTSAGTGNSFKFWNSGTATLMTIGYDGNVGIGTTVPAYLLDVSGSSRHGYRAADTHQFTGSVSVSGSLNATASWATNALTASSLVAANSYTITNLTAINISASRYTGSSAYFSNIGFSDQTVASDTSTFPTGSTSDGLILDGGVYTNGVYRTRFVKIDRSANLSLYIQETKGSSGSFSNLARFGTHANSPNTFEVFGSTNIQGSITSSNFVGPHIGNTIGTASFATTAQTANALNALNTYSIAGLTSAYVDVNGSGTVPTTGIYRPSTKTLGLSADGTLIFKISNVSSPATSSIETGNFIVQTGNVGIGTTSPAQKLHIKSTDTFAAIKFTNSVSDAGIISYSSDNLYFYTANAQRITIDTAGNVGIGTTSPASKLHISGSGQTIMRLDSDTISSVSQFQIKAASNAVLIMGMQGGSAASTNFGVTAAGQAYFGTSTLDSPHPTSLVIGNVSNIPIAFSTNNVERMRIDGVGNVGIGTTIPGAKFEVLTSAVALANQPNIIGNFRGDTDGRSLIRVDNTSTSAGAAALQAGISFVAYSNVSSQPSANKHEAQIILGSTAATSVTGGQTGTLQIVAPQDIAFNVSASNTIMTGSNYTTFGYNAMYIARSGNIGIGTTTTPLKLNVSGSIYMAAGNGSAISWANDISSQFLKYDSVIDGMILGSWNNTTFHTQQIERMRIDTTGNVGIGTTSPGTKLEVSGSIRGGSFPVLVTNTGEAWFGRGSDRTLGTYTLQLGGSSATGTRFEIVDRAWTKVIASISGEAPLDSFLINSSGNVGIGAGVPACKLQVAGNVSGSSFTSSISNAVGFLGTSSFATNASTASFASNTISSSYSLTSSFTTTAQTANALNTSNNYQVNSIGVGMAGSGTAGRIGMNEVGIRSWSITPTGGRLVIEAGDGLGSVIFSCPVTSSNFVGPGTGLTGTAASLTAGTANALNTANSYTIAGLTVNGNISASGTISASKLQVVGTANVIELVQASTGSATYYVMDNTVETGGRRYRFGYSGASADKGSFTIYNATDNITPLTITTSGSVGIGTTSPGALLEVSSSTAASLLNVKGAGGNNLLFVSGSGGVGIGTSTFVYQAANRGFAEIYGSTDALLALKNSTANFYIQKSGNNLAIVNGGAGYVSINTNGSDRFYIASDGNVGIGTTSPSAKLDVTSVTDTFSLINATSGSQGNRAAMFMAARNVNGNVGNVSIEAISVNNQQNDMVFRTGATTMGGFGTERMRIDTTGNVGIGTTVPTRLLQVNGDTLIYANVAGAVTGSKLLFGSFANTTAAAIYSQTTSATSGDLIFAPMSSGTLTEFVRIQSTGNVGIGSTSPAYKLDVAGSVYSSNYFSVLTAATYGPSDNSAAMQVFGSTGSGGLTNTIKFLTGGSERVRIDSSGNVGIGTTIPGSRLEVQFPTNPATDNGVGNNVLRIWTSASFAADVGGAIGLGGTYNTSSYQSFGQIAGRKTNALSSSNAGYLQFATVNNGGTMNEQMRIDASGNVGIGTTNPVAKLQVSSSASTLAASFQGNVGIGNLSGYYYGLCSIVKPTSGLNLNIMYASLSSGYGEILMSNYNDNTGASGWASYIRSYSNPGSDYSSFLTFGTSPASVGGPSERMRIATDGNVGIGTTSPTARLHVSGSTIITGSLNVSANITCLSLTETSTEAVKYNILPLPSQLDNVLKLKPVSFNYKANDKHSIGLIAEEVAKIYPEFTSDNNDSISYGKITSVLIQSIKELKTIIDNQQKQIENLIDKLK